jgi:pyruvate formate lyase activating enzyme
LLTRCAAGVTPGANVSDVVTPSCAARAEALRVGGFVPFTLTDYPGALAAVVFCQGCPWRCGYCHNPHLIAPRGGDEREFARIVDWLGTRRGLLDAVVFSGGEPTAQAELPVAIAAVRALGFKVGLHTGGAYPRRLADVLPHVDWVGFDVKAPRGEYRDVTDVADSGAPAFASLDLLLASGVAHEVRTTVHPALSPPSVLLRLAGELAARGVLCWTLQPFRATGCVNDALVSRAPRGSTIDASLLAKLRAHVPATVIRD